ncbi:MAG: hypothetical protein AB9828_04435 [Sphaerochaetaceae bacterium]|jgi:hypothetical protein
MILQVYFLTLFYLFAGCGLLLVDYYGGKLLLLIRFRNSFRNSVKTQIALTVGGLMLVAGNVFFPVLPGPVLLGDLFPSFMILLLVIYYLAQLMGFRKRAKVDLAEDDTVRLEEAMLEKTGSYIETNKRNLGIAMFICAILHFVFPQAVLL